MPVFDVNLVMNGSGTRQVTIPAGMKFVSIINNSDNTIEIYEDFRTESDSNIRDVLVKVPIYTALTRALHESTQYTFIYHDGGASGDKKAIVTFSDENLQISGVLGNPGTNGTVTMIADAVGLARQSQFPLNLGSLGGLKTEIVNGEVEVKNDAGNPVPVSGTVTLGNPSIEIANDAGNPVPVSGTVTLGNPSIEIANDAGNPVPVSGTVAVSGTVPVIGTVTSERSGKTGVKVTAAAAGTYSVKVTGGRVYAIRAVGADILVKDATAITWFTPSGASDQLSAPITHATSINLTFSAAGDAYIIYE